MNTRITVAIEEKLLDWAKNQAAKTGVSTSRFLGRLIERESAQQKAPSKPPPTQADLVDPPAEFGLSVR